MGDSSQKVVRYRTALAASRILMRLLTVIAVVLSSLLIDGLGSQNADAAENPKASFQTKIPMISMCVGMDTSLLRDPGNGGCRPSMEFSIRWSATSVAPQMCINTSTRFLSLATSGKCLFKGTVAAKPNRPNKFFACAQSETGFLRWPITGKCLTTSTPVRYLAVPLDSKAPVATTLDPPTTSVPTTTTNTTSTTTIPAPVSYSPPTGTTTTTSSTTSTSTTVALAAPVFTLSSGSETKAQNTAITGYTIGSTGGVIASYSISPSAPTGTSFNTSTGLLSGTPSSVQSATTYTITATNATSSASQTFSLTVTTPASCANGGVCALGNTGPGGGKVFYVAPTTFTCGANLELTCKYLEASPIAYNSETWAFSATSALACYTEGSTTGTSDCRYNSIYSGTSASQSSSRSAAYGMGRGLANTNQIYARLTTAGGSLASSYAAGIAYDYSTTVSGTTFTDWYLPSQDELSQMWTNRSSIGELPNADFWTSTEADPNDFRHMFAGTFHTNSGSKSDWTRKVRPIRAFAPIP